MKILISECIEWNHPEYVDRGFFGEIYSAYWLSGPLMIWNRDLECYDRHGPIRVAIKKMNNSQELSQDFINKVILPSCYFYFLNSVHLIIH